MTSKKFEQVSIICKILRKLLGKKYRKLKDFIHICRYSQEQEIISQELSLNSDARIIWGSDNTVSEIKKLKKKIKIFDVLFPDRYSFCLVNSKKFENLTDKELLSFANKFYNDTFIADQNACSSPHLIVWAGKIKEISRQKFWKNLSKLVQLKYQAPELSSVDKYHKFCSDLIKLKHLNSVKIYDNSIYTLKQNLLKLWKISEVDGDISMNLKLKILIQYLKILIENQTLTYFGFKKDTLKIYNE